MAALAFSYVRPNKCVLSKSEQALERAWGRDTVIRNVGIPKTVILYMTRNNFQNDIVHVYVEMIYGMTF